MKIRGVVFSSICLCLFASVSRAALIWIEGENPTSSDVTRHPWWYDKVKSDELSGGDMISNWDENKIGKLEYKFQSPKAGQYEFWVRANPTGKLSYQLNGGAWTPIEMTKAQDSVNIADDDKIDLRFIAWVRADQVNLNQGENVIRFRMESENHHHGMLDCFVFSSEPFQPRGALKPGETSPPDSSQTGWVPFSPDNDPFKPNCPIDLRSLNEASAGDGGFIATKDGHFIHSATGKPLRFWAVNGPPASLQDLQSLRLCARMLAKHGVNMVRIHGEYSHQDGSIDEPKIQHALDIVEAMKAEGIYSHFSIYFPLWFNPTPGTPWAQGYDGKQHPFATLYFNPKFQEVYRSWWKALLTTPSKRTGKRLVDDPAVSSGEMVNEDSYFFWTFAPANVPDPELSLLETQYGDWLKKKYGTLDAALAAWHGEKTERDDLAAGKMGFRPLWNMANQRTARDKDAAAFLTDSQRDFYAQTYQYLRGLGFKGVLTASNWVTASPEYFGPLEKYTYTACDFLDRHGYVDCDDHGPNDGFAIMPDQTYADRDALRFEASEPGKPKNFVNPIMDVKYDDKPSMISETTFNRPNRFRSEAELYYAAYAALQDSDAVINFALDESQWSVKPGYFMQPWTLMSPAMMGQFPAAALLYREGLVSPGDELVSLNLKIDDLKNLVGTPLPQDASFDALRAKDVPAGTELKPGNVIDPLVHYAGRTHVQLSADGGPAKLMDLSAYVSREKQTVTSTNHELTLDYGKGLLKINAPAAQGLDGNLKEAGSVAFKDMTIESDLPLGQIIAVSLDGKPLASSGKILVQAMSEEQTNGWKTEPAANDHKRIVSIGRDPWMIRQITGTVKFTRPDAAKLTVTQLDPNGYPQKPLGHADQIQLLPGTVYYLVSR